jgi:hypothetical protein
MLMTINFLDCLGMKAPQFFKLPYFEGWRWKRTVELDINEPNVSYESNKNGISIDCYSDEVISAVFLFSERFPDRLSDCKFSWTRSQVRKNFGYPLDTRPVINDPILGVYGEADIFSMNSARVHVEYQLDADCVKQFTFMKAALGQ